MRYSKEQQIRAIEELGDRFFVEESLNYKKKLVLEPANLIRSLAIEYHNHLL